MATLSPAQGAPEVADLLADFDALRSAARQELLESQSHFTAAALVPAAHARGHTLVALGSTLGHVSVVDAGRLLVSSRQALQDVTIFRFAAHAGRVTGVVATGAHTLVTAGADGRVRSWRVDEAGAQAAGDLAAPAAAPPLTGAAAAPQLAGGAGCAVCSGADGRAWRLQLVCTVMGGHRAGTAIAALPSTPRHARDRSMSALLVNALLVQSEAGVAEGYGRPLCGSGARITCLAQSPSDPGTLAIARSDGSVTLARSAADYKVYSVFAARCAVARSAADSAVAVPTGDPGCATGEAVACCTFDASGAWLVAASRSGQLRYYSLLANEVAHTATVDCKPTAMVAGANELYIGCATGEVLCGDLFVRSKPTSERKAVSVGARRAVTALLFQPARSGQAACVVAAGAPCMLALISSFAQQVIGALAAPGTAT